MPRLFCAASCSTSCLTASCASATMAGWPTPRASASCPRCARCSVHRRPAPPHPRPSRPTRGRPRCFVSRARTSPAVRAAGRGASSSSPRSRRERSRATFPAASEAHELSRPSSLRHARDPRRHRLHPNSVSRPFPSPDRLHQANLPNHFPPLPAPSAVTFASQRLQHPASETPRASPISIAGAGFVQRDFFTHRGIACGRRPSCAVARRAKKPSSLCHRRPHP